MDEDEGGDEQGEEESTAQWMVRRLRRAIRVPHRDQRVRELFDVLEKIAGEARDDTDDILWNGVGAVVEFLMSEMMSVIMRGPVSPVLELAIYDLCVRSGGPGAAEIVSLPNWGSMAKARRERALKAFGNGLSRVGSRSRTRVAEFNRQSTLFNMFAMMHWKNISRKEALQIIDSNEDSIKQYVQGFRRQMLSGAGGFTPPKWLIAAMTQKSKPKKRRQQFARSIDVRPQEAVSASIAIKSRPLFCSMKKA
jgi:hypothetical protein